MTSTCTSLTWQSYGNTPPVLAAINRFALLARKHPATVSARIAAHIGKVVTWSNQRTAKYTNPKRHRVRIRIAVMKVENENGENHRQRTHQHDACKVNTCSHKYSAWLQVYSSVHTHRRVQKQKRNQLNECLRFSWWVQPRSIASCRAILGMGPPSAFVSRHTAFYSVCISSTCWLGPRCATCHQQVYNVPTGSKTFDWNFNPSLE